MPSIWLCATVTGNDREIVLVHAARPGAFRFENAHDAEGRVLEPDVFADRIHVRRTAFSRGPIR